MHELLPHQNDLICKTLAEVASGLALKQVHDAVPEVLTTLRQALMQEMLAVNAGVTSEVPPCAGCSA